MVERDEHSSRLQEQAASKEPESNPPSAGRRRFVTGLSYSLPAVVTLYHGAVLAGPSSMMCLSKRPNTVFPGPHLVPPPTGLPGEHAAKQVNNVRTYTKSGGPDVVVYYDSIDHIWRQAQDGTPTSDPPLTDPNSPPPAPPGYTLSPTISSGYAVAYVDNNGDIQALGYDAGSGALPAGCSCWTSTTGSGGSCVVP